MALTKINRPDGQSAQFGTSNDLTLTHDGNHSYIDSITGSLKIRSNNGNMAVFTPDGAVELYHNEVKTFETTSDGWKSVDGFKGVWGTGDDLQIWHDAGAGSNIRCSGSKLEIRSDALNLQASNAEKYLLGTANGSVELYYDNVKKFDTRSNGVNIHGLLVFDKGDTVKYHRIVSNDTGSDLGFQQSAGNSDASYTSYLRIKDGGDIALPVDDKKLLFGAGEDLEIYHDGSNTYLHNNTGRLRLESDNLGVGFYKGAGSETLAMFNIDAECSLYYNNSKKIETTADGISVTGDIFGSGKLDLPDNGYLKLGTGDDLEIWHDGSNSYIKNSTNALTIQGAGVYINDVANAKTSASFDTDGAAELYYDNVKVLETHANGIFIKGPEGGDASVYFYSDEGDDDADKWRWRNDNNSTMLLEAKDSGSWYTHLQVSNSWTTIKSREANQGSSVVKIKKPDAANNVQSTVITFEIDDAGRGQIVAASSGSANPQFSTWSDRRLKTNFRPYTGGYDKIKAIPVKLYDEISTDETKSIIGDNPATNVVGWIADEFQTVFPEAVTGTKDAVDSDGKPIYQSLTQGTIFPDVIQALQAAIAKIETLETKVAALESA